MKIGINGRFLTKPYTGIGQYTKYLFLAIAKQNPLIRLIVVTPEKIEIDAPPNLEIHVVEEKFPGTAGMRKTWWEQFQVPHFLEQKGVDIFHFPYPCNPWRASAKPVVVTVHDTIPWSLPAYSRTLSTRFYQHQSLKALKRADRILAVSQTVKHELLSLCEHSTSQKTKARAPSESETKTNNNVVAKPLPQIVVIYNAPGPHFFGDLTAGKKQSVMRKYRINQNKPYILYVGGYDERKNVMTPVNIFLKKIALRYNVDFVLVGDKSLQSPLYASFDRLTQLKSEGRLRTSKTWLPWHKEPAVKGRLILTGFVAEQDLPALYQSALFFISFSKKEGCNLPLLEAVASKVPIIASDLAVHREMVGNIALFCPLNNKGDLAHLIVKLLTDKTFYQKHKQKSLAYQCPFSWKKTAKKVTDIYGQLLPA